MILSILVIHNPVAGRRWRRSVDQLFELLVERGFKVRVELTAQRGDARDAARLVNGVDVIVAAGGDGTVNEIVDGLAARETDDAVPAIAFLPLGTANVLAWELDLPRNPRGLVRLIEENETLKVCPGIANGRRIILMASVGLDARAVAAVKTTAKRMIGGGAYLLAALTALRQTPPCYKVTVDGRDFEAATVIVSRARRYGGPFSLTPDAGLETGALQIVMMRSYGLVPAVRYALALAFGRLHQLHDVMVVPGRKVSIDGPRDEPVQIDGDIVTRLPLEICMDSQAVAFLVPASSSVAASLKQ